MESIKDYQLGKSEIYHLDKIPTMTADYNLEDEDSDYENQIPYDDVDISIKDGEVIFNVDDVDDLEGD